MKRIGVIGKGFVGSAVSFGFGVGTGADYEIKIYDKDETKSSHSLEDTVNTSDYIFISVPTPSNPDGSINLDILDNCLSEIKNVMIENHDPVILISQLLYRGLQKCFQKFKSLNLVFNPEFLTERNAQFDFISQTRYVLGGDKKLTKKVADLYKDRFGESVSIIETNFETAELIKYMCNTYFALKMIFS